MASDRALWRALALLAGLAWVATGAADAQVVYSESYPDNYPPPLPRREGPLPPPIILEWTGEVPIVGPLRTGPLAVEGENVVVPTSDGVVRVTLGPEPSTSRRPDAPAPQDASLFEWVVEPEGRFRCRTSPEGGVTVEKRRRGASRWRKAWSIDTAAPLSFPPIPLGRRLIFATSDGRVFAVRLSNGHRLWATDLGERLSASATVWFGSPAHAAQGERPDGSPYALLLVIPDSGTALLALDVYDGRVLARGAVPEGEGRLVSSPHLLADGRIAAARQGYALDDAGLGLFRVRESPAPPSPDASPAVPYNAPDPSP